MVVLSILIAIVVADVLWWRRAARMLRPLRRAAWWRLLLGVFMGGQLVLLLWMLSGRVLADSSLGRPPRVLTASVYLWHLLVLPAAWGTVGITALLAWSARAWQGQAGRDALCGRGREEVQPAGGDPLTRRELLGGMTVVVPPLVTGGVLAYSRTQLPQFRVRPLDVALPGLPKELDGVRIAVVSDMHVGPFTHGRTVKRIVEETNRLRADLVLLPGDLINSALGELPDALDAVAGMESRHGCYLCVGNHDLIEDGAEFVRRTRARVPLLVNESRVVEVRGRPVELLGLPWVHDGDRMVRHVQDLARRVTPGAFPILLAHHPHAFDAAAAEGIPLTVSGHTHGGQLMLTETLGFGPLLFRYWSGLYRKPEHNDAALVVSNGVGNWFPLRTCAPAEILHLTLRSGGAVR